MLWTPTTHYEVEPYSLEAELEAAIYVVKEELFGPDRIYLDVKKKIGGSGMASSIPDGYLNDLTSHKKPKLYVVENELASHDPLKHVAVQILQFSLAFDASKPKVKAVIQQTLDAQPAIKQKCLAYAQANDLVNLDYLLRLMIDDGEFGAVVIIDDLSDELEKVFKNKLKIPVDVITLKRFINSSGDRIYEFEPFLSRVVVPSTGNGLDANAASAVDPSDIDTIIVPARSDGFQETFLKESRWYAVRIAANMIPKIKYIAAYVSAPTSGITHLAPVKGIEQWQDTNKYVVNFAESAQPIGPLSLVPQGQQKALQNIRYTSHERLSQAKNLDEAF